MAHNIFFNENTQEHNFFSVKEKPWHGLGKIVTDYPTSAEALRFAGLNYEVTKEPLFTTFFNSDGLAHDYTKLVPSHYATVRSDTGAVLGVVGEDYEVIQNTDAFSFFDSIVGGDGILYETAGALGRGYTISVFVPHKARHYMRSLGLKSKDDRVDAKGLAQYSL
jgi:hypothetical protein